MGAGRLLVVAVLLCAPLTASAETANEREARLAFEEGSKAFNLGEFQRAIAAYRKAYNLVPDAVFLYNIAQAYRLNNDSQQALFFYKSFLSNRPDAPNRKDVERRIRDLEAQLEKQKMPPNTFIEPGRLPQTTHPPEPASPTAPEPVKPAPATVEPAPATTAPATPETATATDKKTPVYKKWWLWTVVGVAVVGVAVGVGVGVATSGPEPAPSSHFGVSSVSF
jgi:tetratricopeptide (TPR) repeat protein